VKVDFDTFWQWLFEDTRDYLRLGEQLKADGEHPADEDNEEEIHEPPIHNNTADRPPHDSVRIGPNPSGGIITVASGNTILFTRELAEATWHRYHGLRQTACQLQTTAAITLPARIPHRMASAFALPNNNNRPLPQNWIDCPQPMRAPAFIAAAIRCYCRRFPQLGLCPPDAPLSPSDFLQCGHKAPAVQKSTQQSGQEK
jgi:hypothetical protein